MLMPRLQYPNAFNSEMSIALSMQHQQNHINQLLNTAAAGTGIVGDVDALLTPISMPPQQNTSTTTPMQHQIRERNLWRINEVKEMLNIMQELSALELLNDKTMKSEMVFRKVEKVMNERGYCKKSHVQIWTKWKFLKTTYTTSKRNGTIPKMIPFEIYEELHKMLDSANISVGRRTLSDRSNSVNSLNGDISNGGGDAKHLIISGVEGGYSNGNANLADGDSETGDENTFGMAHPIFGFRLGLVKQEPADTGYETIGPSEKDPLEELNVINRDSTANIQFQTEIKQEFIEATTPLTHTPAPETSQSPPPLLAPVVSLEQRLEEPITPDTLRLNNRPVRIQPKPIATSTPTITTAAPTEILPMPPLRIAPFAKVSNENAFSPIVNRPPPPLSMQPHVERMQNATNGAGISLGSVSGGSGNGNMPHKLPVHNTTAEATPMRRQMETMIQPSRFAQTQLPNHNNMPRLKVLTTHKTPYSLRPERVLPDPDSSTSPPDFTKQQYFMYQDGPSTSQQAYNPKTVRRVSIMPVKKKRRLNVPPITAEPIKMPRTYANQKLHKTKYHDFGGNKDDSSSDCNAETSCEPQYQHFEEPPTAKRIRHESTDNIEASLIELTKAMRQIQQDGMKEFFQKQMELVRQEHDFQMQQDFLIMEAFKRQSQTFMIMANKLLYSAAMKMDGEVTVGARPKKTSKPRKKVNEISNGIYQPRTTNEQLLKTALKARGAQATLETDEAAEADEEDADGSDEGDEANDENATGNEQQHENVNEHDDDDDEEEEEDDGEEEDEDEEVENEHDQIEYEDNEYLQDNSGDIDQEDTDGDNNDDDDDEDDVDDDEEEEANEVGDNSIAKAAANGEDNEAVARQQL